MTLSKKDIKYLANHPMLVEGVDYTFMEHSSFKEIKNEEFHELLKNWRLSRIAFLKYAGLLEVMDDMCEDPEEDSDDFGL